MFLRIIPTNEWQLNLIYVDLFIYFVCSDFTVFRFSCFTCLHWITTYGCNMSYDLDHIYIKGRMLEGLFILNCTNTSSITHGVLFITC